jgi:hypothetical protein
MSTKQNQLDNHDLWLRAIVVADYVTNGRPTGLTLETVALNVHYMRKGFFDPKVGNMVVRLLLSVPADVVMAMGNILMVSIVKEIPEDPNIKEALSQLRKLLADDTVEKIFANVESMTPEEVKAKTVEIQKDLTFEEIYKSTHIDVPNVFGAKKKPSMN